MQNKFASVLKKNNFIFQKNMPLTWIRTSVRWIHLLQRYISACAHTYVPRQIDRGTRSNLQGDAERERCVCPVNIRNTRSPGIREANSIIVPTGFLQIQVQNNKNQQSATTQKILTLITGKKLFFIDLPVEFEPQFLTLV